ncbi:Cys-tRNA(Pro) deacylase, prolyl-tRNA editing enzyme YbaK/EbsC [Geodermatophilus telluris]|uniref:Cys-tRNA(Pro) deacylase, prolyl-tRNA editing enzyme YbaK/EbsC n=1 Tax=Geodermatophilus telluris TaxID=1190417 RepID=A0A1G6S7M5_9ACTN|nr:YbaK/EbsC family protein [Geodermatophilus telluris]SDD12829.1 Cys-tRNA(Pro) deacylase, prolyl-tRNA editing enzyme YbaK/EbsC [Geodermatophilus telluris]
MSRPVHPRVAAIADLLSGAGASGRVHELPSGAHTAAEAAAALGVPIGAIANSLVFDVDGAPLLVLTSGAHRVDVARVAALLGVRQVRRASADFVREHTGQPIGGVAPLGHPTPIGTLVDVELARHDRVWAAAGHPSAVFPTSYDELLRLTAGTAAEVGDGPTEAARAEAATHAAAPPGTTPRGTTPTGTTHDPAAAVGP